MSLPRLSTTLPEVSPTLLELSPMHSELSPYLYSIEISSWCDPKSRNTHELISIKRRSNRSVLFYVGILNRASVWPSTPTVTL